MTHRARRTTLRSGLALALGLAHAVGPAGGVSGQETDSAAVAPAAPPPEAATDTTPPPIGMVEFFGHRSFTEDSLRAMLGLPPEPAGLAKPPVVESSALPLLATRLATVPGIEEAHFEAVCCHRGSIVLFIGIRETGSEVGIGHRPDPTGDVRLPDEIVAAYEDFLGALERAVREGRTGDDLSLGHSLVVDSAARSYQLRFPALAEAHLDLLREALHESADVGHRAVAAAVIGYAEDKTSVAPDLVRALRDPDPAVRNNATRSLAAIAVYANRNPDAGVEIPLPPLVEMLGSVVWTDRNKALSLLLYLAEPGDETILPVLRREALPELVEMARWRSPGHALPAFVLIGRISGLADEDALQAWREGRRDEVIERAASPPSG